MTTSTVVKFVGDTHPNPGPAAIGFIVETDNWTHEVSEHVEESTNARAEYHAIIRGLELPPRRDVPRAR